MSLPPIETLDTDGALREAGDAVAGDTRAVFFRKAALGGGAVITSGSIMAALPELAAGAKPSRRNDVRIANFALTLEFLEANFYETALQQEVLKFTVPGLGNLVELLAKHERAHCVTLQRFLRTDAVAEPTFDFGEAMMDEQKFLQTALTLENTGVAAYLGQIGGVKRAPLLKAAATIATTEARHAAAVASLIGSTAGTGDFGETFMDKTATSVTPSGAFDVPQSKKAILAAVQQTGFTAG